jgi:hypothetical protein
LQNRQILLLYLSTEAHDSSCRSKSPVARATRARVRLVIGGGDRGEPVETLTSGGGRRQRPESKRMTAVGQNRRGRRRSAMGTNSGFMRRRCSGAYPATGRGMTTSARHKEACCRVGFVWRSFIRGELATSRGGAWLHWRLGSDSVRGWTTRRCG